MTGIGPEQVRLIAGRTPEDVLAKAWGDHEPREAFVLFSGGKDSSVTLDLLWRQHSDVITGALHIGTGIAVESTAPFAQEFCDRRSIPYFMQETTFSYEDIVLKHGFPGPAQHGKMYTSLKERPLRAFVKSRKVGRIDRVALITGVRAEESLRRMGTCRDVNRVGNSVWVAPLIDFTAHDMARYRAKHDVPVSPSSRAIHLSGDCICGAFGQEQDLPLIAAMYPDLGRRIWSLEKRAEAAGVYRCKWGRRYEDTTESPNQDPLFEMPMCQGCILRGGQA